MRRPPVHYATTADGLKIAYQVLGNGPLDVVIVPGLFSNIDRNTESPFYSGYLRRVPRLATAMMDAARGLGLELRAGLHTGEVELRGADLIPATVPQLHK